MLIRKELRNKQTAVLESLAERGRLQNGAITIIKPGKKYNHKNLIDILDEIAIPKIETYVIVNDITPEESKLLASNYFNALKPQTHIVNEKEETEVSSKRT